MIYAIFDNMIDDGKAVHIEAETPRAALHKYHPTTGASEFYVMPLSDLNGLHETYGCPVSDDIARQYFSPDYGVEDLTP